MKHTFIVQTDWTSGRNGIGSLQAQRLQTDISIPPEMNGPGIGTNPDEMLLGAASTCYIISLAAMLERTKIEATLQISSEGIVDVTNGVFTYEKIIHHVTITLAEQTEHNDMMAKRLAQKAEQTCMISKALRGNVEMIVDIQML